MKVAYFLGALNRGGAETLILDICRQHENVPFNFVCCYRHEGNISEEFKASGAPLIQIQKSGGLLNYILQVRRVLLREKITIVHSQTPSNTLILAVALHGTGIKIITTFHGHTFAPAPWWKRKIVYTASKKILCVSRYEKSFYEQRWGLPKENKLEVVYNGIDFAKLDAVKSIVESEELRDKSGIRLCMVGNFVSGRSQIVVCKALQKLIVKSEELRVKWDFYFIGRRDEKQAYLYDECVRYCEEHSLNNVHFLGSRNDVPALLKTMDGFVYSTVHDTFGIAVIEAIASGLPVVVNDWDVMKEVCGDENDGIRYFKTGDADDAADKIEEQLANLQHSKKVAEANAKLVREKYSIDNHIQRLNEIYSLIEE